MNKEGIHNKEMTLAQFIEETIKTTDEHEYLEASYSDTCEMLKKSKKIKKDVAREMIKERRKANEEIKEFESKPKEMIEPIKEVRKQIKEKLKLIEKQELDKKNQREIDVQKYVIKEQHIIQGK